MGSGHESEGSEAVRGCIAGVSIGFYWFLMSGPKMIRPSVNVSATTKSVDLTIQTVAAVGPSSGGVRCKATIGRGRPLYRLEVPRR